MAWVDSHCHLDFEVFSTQENLHRQLLNAGCQGILVPAISAQYFERLIHFQEYFSPTKSGFVNIAMGLHPYFLCEFKPEHIKILDQKIAIHKPCAVGEIGLDYVLPQDSHELQLSCFEQQVILAIKHGLPLVVHCRKAHDPLAAVLRRLKFHHGGIIHAFSGSSQQAQNYLKLGFVLGLGGALTFDRAKAMHKMVKALPNDAYVLETDSPDMAPAFAQNAINNPLNIPKIAQYIAHLREEPLTKVYAHSTQNFERAMNLRIIGEC